MTAREEFLEAIFEAAPDAVVISSLEGLIEVVNPAAERMFHYAASELMGRRLDCIVTTPALFFAEGCISGEGLGTRKMGTNFPVEISTSFFEHHGKDWFLLMVRDVSRRKVSQQALEEVYERSLEASRAAGKAEVAADVLHNVGNLLNSVNTSTNLLSERISRSLVSHVGQIAQLLEQHEGDLPRFFSQDSRGPQVVTFVSEVAKELEKENTELRREAQWLQQLVDHLKSVVASQHSRAVAGGVIEQVDAGEILEYALLPVTEMLDRSKIQVSLKVGEVPPFYSDRHLVLQIMINLVKNACEAISAAPGGDSGVLIVGAREQAEHVVFEVEDNGIGIASESVERLFSRGFTTKPDGHGFGLHRCALHARQLGGRLTVHSDGVGCGATFRLSLPLDEPLRAGTFVPHDLRVHG